MDNTSLNNFVREHFNTYIKANKNCIKHDPGTGREHRRLVNDICDWLLDNNITFFTRVHLNTGKIADIVAPELARPIIEVRSSEEKKDKEYLDKYEKLMQFVDVSNPFKLM